MSEKGLVEGENMPFSDQVRLLKQALSGLPQNTEKFPLGRIM